MACATVVMMKTVLVSLYYLNFALIIKTEDVAKVGQYDSSSQLVSSSAIDRGKKNMDDLMARGKLPKYGPCWTEALHDLKVACKFLDAKLQSKLAFAFTSCFVEMLGFPPYLCTKDSAIEDCVGNLDQRGYNTFLEYFLHTQDMCFYLSSQVWQEETDRTVNQLASTAAQVTLNMDETKRAQEKILQSQKDALEVQTTLMNDNNALYKAIVKVKQIFDDFRVTADEHQQIFMEIFEKISKVQNLVGWIQGEMSLFDMFGFYFLALIFGLVATSSKRTISARFWLIILFTTTFFLERFLTNLWMSLDKENQLEPEQLQQRVWWFRRFSTFIGGCIIMLTGLMYQDYNVQNNHSLRDMQSKLEKLMVLVDGNGPKPHTSVAQPLSQQSGVRHTGVFSSGTLADIGLDSDDDTFTTDSDSDTSGYSKDSESSSDTSASIEVEVLEKLQLIKDGKEMFPDLDKENNPVSRRVGLNGRDDDLPNGPPIQTSTPKAGQTTPDDSMTRRYNLRARKPSLSANPVLNIETPKAFARKVKESRRKSEKLTVDLFKRK